MMGGIFFWLILGVVLYLLFSRRGGMSGCCGGHGHNPSEFAGRNANRYDGHADPHDDIIDLKKEDYHVH